MNSHHKAITINATVNITLKNSVSDTLTIYTVLNLGKQLFEFPSM